MENKTASLCKFTAVIVWLLGCVGSFMYAKAAATIEYRYEESFDFESFILVLLACLLVVFILGLLLVSLGEIIQLLQDQKDRPSPVSSNNEIRNTNKAGLISNSNSNLLESANKEQRRSTGYWECKECKTTNQSTALFCKDCGTYR